VFIQLSGTIALVVLVFGGKKLIFLFTSFSDVYNYNEVALERLLCENHCQRLSQSVTLCATAVPVVLELVCSLARAKIYDSIKMVEDGRFLCCCCRAAPSKSN
jgi:hypothetical protein